MRGKCVEAMKNDERVEDNRREDVVGSKRGRHRGRCWRKLAQKAVASYENVRSTIGYPKAR